MNELRGKASPGRGAAVLVYGLYLGGVMTLVTIPLGALLAAWRLPRATPWVRSHLAFQLWTFLGLLLSALVFFGAWRLLGWLELPALSAWATGYLYATLALAWFIGRCAVGINRLTGNRPMERPSSPFLGGVRPSLGG
jgi:uncharacterized membrane protein